MGVIDNGKNAVTRTSCRAENHGAVPLGSFDHHAGAANGARERNDKRT